MSSMENGVNFFVDGTRAVKIVSENDARTELNIWPGSTPIWFGGNNRVKAGGAARKIEAGINPVLITSKAEIWIIRLPGDAGICGVGEEFS